VRYNALVFCSEDGAMVQLGLGQLRQPKVQSLAGAEVLTALGSALESAKLKSFTAAMQSGMRAEKAAEKAESDRQRD
jgi:hypothetical protein